MRYEIWKNIEAWFQQDVCLNDLIRCIKDNDDYEPNTRYVDLFQEHFQNLAISQTDIGGAYPFIGVEIQGGEEEVCTECFNKYIVEFHIVAQRSHVQSCIDCNKIKNCDILKWFDLVGSEIARSFNYKYRDDANIGISNLFDYYKCQLEEVASLNDIGEVIYSNEIWPYSIEASVDGSVFTSTIQTRQDGNTDMYIRIPIIARKIICTDCIKYRYKKACISC